MGIQVATVLSLKRPTQSDCPQRQDDAGVLVGLFLSAYARKMGVTEQELMQFCRDRLSPYKVPHRVVFSEMELPKNAAGKILRRVLRERLLNISQRAIAWNC